MPSHLALLSCLLVLLLSLDKFLLHYLKKRLFSGPRIPTGAPKSRRSMAAAAKWSETAMLVIDMQVFLTGAFLFMEKFAILDFELFLTASCSVASFSFRRTSWTRGCAAPCWWPAARPSSPPSPRPWPSRGSAASSSSGSVSPLLIPRALV